MSPRQHPPRRIAPAIKFASALVAALKIMAATPAAAPCPPTADYTAVSCAFMAIATAPVAF